MSIYDEEWIWEPVDYESDIIFGYFPVLLTIKDKKIIIGCIVEMILYRRILLLKQ